MTSKDLTSTLSLLGAEADGEGAYVMAEGKTLSVQVAHNGVGHGVSRIERLEIHGELLKLLTKKGDMAVVSVGDVYALSCDGSKARGRAAGFAAS